MECPERGILLDFVLGRLSPERIDFVYQHLENCAACTACVAALDHLPVPFLVHAQLDGLHPSMNYAREPEFRQALNQVRRLVQQRPQPTDAADAGTDIGT